MQEMSEVVEGAYQALVRCKMALGHEQTEEAEKAVFEKYSQKEEVYDEEVHEEGHDVEGQKEEEEVYDDVAYDR